MADRYGLLEIPVQAAIPFGDPVLAIIGDHAKTVLNSAAATAWPAFAQHDVQAPSPDIYVPPDTQAVRTVFAGKNPRRYEFEDIDLPALFLHRQRGRTAQQADDKRVRVGRIRFVWIAPRDHYYAPSDREAFMEAVMAVLDAAIENVVDPSWVYAGDTDLIATGAVAEPDSIKTAIATSTSAQSYSGAALNGSTGGTTMSPRRQATVTLAPAPGAYSTEPIVFTVVDWYDATTTRSVQPPDADGGITIGIDEDVKAVVQIDVPPQLSADGSFQFGTGEVEARGSNLLELTRAERIELVEWQATQLPIEILNDDGALKETLQYDAVEGIIEIEERYVPDLTARAYPHADAPGGIDIDVYREDRNVSRAELRSD
ncbi:MAG: hypothetical protein HOW73_20565 [Polyangiaceae bacterium]|nr:hypothetical protein [Polyangiaceae bacterium]